MNDMPVKKESVKRNYPKVFWWWFGGMVAVVFVIALCANLGAVQNQLQAEWVEHVTGPMAAPVPPPAPVQVQIQIPAVSQAQVPVQLPAPMAQAPQSAGGAQNNAPMPVAFNPGTMGGTYRQIADTMKNITASIFSDIGPQTEPVLLGTGIILSSRQVLTNYHIVKDRVNLFITTEIPGAASYPARLIRFDPNNDLALLDVNSGGGFPVFAKIGNSDAVSTGDIIFAMGNAFGNGNFFTSGMVLDTHMAYDANQVAHPQLFQTNLNIYPGFCGSPLVNLQGEIIGINSSIGCPNNIGMGRALPIGKALPLLRGAVQGSPGLLPDGAPQPSMPLPLSSPRGNPYSLV